MDEPNQGAAEIKRTIQVSQLIAGAVKAHDAGEYVSTNLTINLLLEEALNEPDIGITSRFRWHATAVGIAALWIDNDRPSIPPYEEALKKGSMWGSTSAERNEIPSSGTGTGAAVSFINRSNRRERAKSMEKRNRS